MSILKVIRSGDDYAVGPSDKPTPSNWEDTGKRFVSRDEAQEWVWNEVESWDRFNALMEGGKA